jgi:GTPase
VKPIVAVVGRPNVGKSTLFNRLVGAQVAIVHDAPGVTRDRNYADANLAGMAVTFVDTGGFDPTTEDPMGQGIAKHVRAAIEEADLIVCVLDGSLPPTQPDREAIHLLRRAQKPVLFVANKMDGQEKEWGLGDYYELGVEELIPVSALHGRHVGKLEAAILALLPKPDGEAEDDSPTDETSVVLLGRPNAGKSSLFNRLTGEERSLVDSRPGTTRDPVDSWFEYKGQRYRALDTAGIRRKSKVDVGVEAASVMRSLRAIDRAHVVILMVDATSGLAEQDARLLGLCRERGRSVVVGMNKADLLDREGQKKADDDAKTALHFAQLMAAVDKAAVASRKRVSTGELNRFFERVLLERQPPTRGGKSPRIYYITQTGTNPPTFVTFCSSPEHVAEAYRRFVINRIRAEFEFDAAPIRVNFRGRDRDG